MTKLILSADIGGTSSRYALFSRQQHPELELLRTHWLKTGEFSSFDQQLRRLLDCKFIDAYSEIDCCIIAGAGPVEKGVRIRLTQVPWEIELGGLDGKLRARHSVAINDFVAQAFSCLTQIGDTAERVLFGQRNEEGNIVVIGAGTGLGMAMLVKTDSNTRLAIESEGGHVTYGAECIEEVQFARFIVDELKVNYASWEDALSGRGLELTHKFLTGEVLTAAEIGGILHSAPRTVSMFARNYGRICRNLALQYLSTGGVYIAGGIAAKNRCLVEHSFFETSFRSPRQHQHLLAKIPVYLLDNQESGLWGAAYLGSQLLERAR